MKPTEIVMKAQKLRKEGMSLKRIARLLSLSPSTVQIWTKNTLLSNEQKDVLRRKGGEKSGDLRSKKAREIRSSFQEQGKKIMNQMDSLFIAGCMLYWAEGAKQKNVLSFTNSDPAMICLFMKFLRSRLKIKDKDIRIYLNCCTKEKPFIETKEFWKITTGLPDTCFGKAVVDHPKQWKGTRTKCPFGICNITVCSTNAVQKIFGAIREFANIKEEKWLD